MMPQWKIDASFYALIKKMQSLNTKITIFVTSTTAHRRLKRINVFSRALYSWQPENEFLYFTVQFAFSVW